jgi:hypothetical protein
MNLRKIISSGVRGLGSITGGFGAQGGFGGTAFGLNTEGRNWNREAGARFDNPIVYAGLQYVSGGFMEMRPYVRRRKGDGWERVNNHPAETLLDACTITGEPAPWYDGTTLESGWTISELCGRGGMSYTFKHRSSGGRLVALEYLPHFAVQPFCSPGSGNFIDWYRVSVAGAYGSGYMQLERKDILAMRYGPINPYRLVEGVGPLEACLLEVVTDKQAAQFTAALVANVGITPHYFKPGWKTADGGPGKVEKESWDEFLAVYDDKITGPNRGKPLTSSLPLDVVKLGFSPSEMDMGAIRNIPEERICAALRIHPNSLYLGTGLEQANNRASSEVAEKQSARNCLKPYAIRRGKQLTQEFMAEGLLAPDEEIYFPTENLEALQEDKSERAKRLIVACGGAYISVNEARQMDGLAATPNPEDDEVRSAGTSAVADDDSDEDGAATVGAKPKRATPTKTGKNAK